MGAGVGNISTKPVAIFDLPVPLIPLRTTNPFV
jgi:hypothetical protein